VAISGKSVTVPVAFAPSADRPAVVRLGGAGLSAPRTASGGGAIVAFGLATALAALAGLGSAYRARSRASQPGAGP
jgi:hypothetical protein